MALKYTEEGAVTTVMSTELNALADNDQAISSSAFSNDAASERNIFASYEIYIPAQGGARDASAAIILAIVPEVDDANYASYDDEKLMDNLSVKEFTLDAAATAVYLVVNDVKLPPSDYKVALRQETNQALAATLNTVKERRYSYEDVT